MHTLLKFAPGAFAVSACSSRLGRRWIRFRLRGSTLVRIILRSCSTNQFETGRPCPLLRLVSRPTFFAPPLASPRLRDLAPETDQARTQGLLTSTTWLNGTFVTETEVAQSQGGAGWLQSRIPGDTPGDAPQRMVRLGLTGAAGSIRYGMLSRSAGQAFLNGPDQAQREVWGEWNPAGRRCGARSENSGTM